LIAYHGLGGAIKSQLSSPSLKLFSPAAWWKATFEGGFGPCLAAGDAVYADDKRQLLKDAHGQVLEVGPGAGHTVKYYPSAVQKVYGVEPFEALHGELRKSIGAAGMTSKYTASLWLVFQLGLISVSDCRRFYRRHSQASSCWSQRRPIRLRRLCAMSL
jgi:hypothetical protein